MKEKKISGKIYFFIVIFILLFIFLYTYIYIIPSITGKMKDTYVLQYGTVSIGEESKYLVIRDETLYYASNTGSVTRYYDEGTLVRSGTGIVSVGSKNYYNDERGLVSYSYDGLEDRYIIDELKGLKPDEVDSIESMKTDSEGNEIELLKECQLEVTSGEPIFKIVSNDKWYLIIWLNKSVAVNLNEGSKINIGFDDDGTASMVVYKLYDEGDITEVVLSSNSYLEDFDKLRIGNAKIITEEVSGLLLETDSIVDRDGIKGVYIVNSNDETVFRPIKILLENGDTTVVSRNYFYDSEGNYTYTVKIYDNVLRNYDGGN